MEQPPICDRCGHSMKPTLVYGDRACPCVWTCWGCEGKTVREMDGNGMRL